MKSAGVSSSSLSKFAEVVSDGQNREGKVAEKGTTLGRAIIAKEELKDFAVLVLSQHVYHQCKLTILFQAS